MTWWMWLVCATLASATLEVLGGLFRDMALMCASAIDRFGDPPEMQVSALLGHVPDRGDDAAGDGGRGEVDVTGACPGAQSRD